MAAETSDTLLILDDDGAGGPSRGRRHCLSARQRGGEAARISHRHSTSAALLARAVLRTGEITLAQKMGEAGKRATAGLGVRLPNLPADAGAGMGVFRTFTAGGTERRSLMSYGILHGCIMGMLRACSCKSSRNTERQVPTSCATH